MSISTFLRLYWQGLKLTWKFILGQLWITALVITSVLEYRGTGWGIYFILAFIVCSIVNYIWFYPHEINNKNGDKVE